MSQIKVLNQDVVNQIAAGEVVERPAHLIKELVENSIDAGSTQVHIEVSSGGRYIKVTDNGSGIESDDLSLALTRHATSKIVKTDDLWSLNTFGFRGEALASASAISKLHLTSKSERQKESYQIRSEFGKLSTVMPGNKSQGTEILIEDLFENVPARLKFLKSENSEYAQVKNVVKAMALLNPQIEFKLTSNGQLDLFYNKKENGLKRVEDILNVKQAFYHQASRGLYKAEAFFCSPEDVSKTSKNIWIFSQNRWIQDKGLQAAVMEAYRHLLMHGEYPLCVVHLHCDPKDIDVNIHPTKSQVKFQDPSLAFRAVQASLREGLEKAPWIIRTESKTESSQEQPKHRSDHQHFELNSSLNVVSKNIYAQSEIKNHEFYDPVFKHTQIKEKSYALQEFQNLRVAETDIKMDSNKKNLESMGYWSSFHIIGQLHLTYIVCQKDNKMILVDQHAAHERVAFEKLMHHWKNSESKYFDLQDYLFPLAIDLTAEKVEVLMQQTSQLGRMGIVIEALGPQTIGIKSAPSFIKGGVFAQVFDKMSDELLEHGGSHRLDRAISDIFATMACHSVVRAGQSLSLEEMKTLLVEMDFFPLSSFCPHGRPVSVEMDIQAIEKMFGRIV